MNNHSDLSDLSNHAPDIVRQNPHPVHPQTPARYRITQRRAPGTSGLAPRTVGTDTEARPVRNRRKPGWMASNDWILLAAQFPAVS